MTTDTTTREPRTSPANGAGVDPQFCQQGTKGAANAPSVADLEIIEAKAHDGTLTIPLNGMLNNSNLVSLVRVWKAADQQTEALQKFTQKEIQAEDLKTKADQEQEQKDWLKSMSPEYQEAYNNFLNDLNQADQEDDQLLAKLEKQRQSVEKEIQEQDEKAIKLSGGRNAYLDKNGNYRYGNGQEVEGQDLKDAETYRQQHPEANTSYEEHNAAATKEQKTIDAEKGLNDDKTQNAAARTNAEDGNLKEKNQVAEADKAAKERHKQHLEDAQNAFNTPASESPSTTATSSAEANFAGYQRHSARSHANTVSESAINATSASQSFNANASPAKNNTPTQPSSGPNASNLLTNSNPSVKQMAPTHP